MDHQCSGGGGDDWSSSKGAQIDKMSAKHRQNPLRYECLLRGSFRLINWHTFQGETRALCIMHTSFDNTLQNFLSLLALLFDFAVD